MLIFYFKVEMEYERNIGDLDVKFAKESAEIIRNDINFV